MRKLPWEKLVTLLIACVFSLSITTAARSSERTYQLSTGISSGDFYPIGIALKTLLTLKRSKKQNIILDVHQSEGAQANLIALLEGKADIAFVDASTILAAFTKKPPFDKFTNIGELQALASLWPDIAHFIIQEPQVSSGDVGDFRNLIGENISIGSQTTASAFAARELFNKTGIYHDKMFRMSDYGIYRTTEAFIDGTLSGAALFTHQANKNIARILAEPNNNSTLLHISNKHLKAINETQIPIWQRHIIEANTYKNQLNPINSISQANFLVVRQNFNKKDAYTITKTLFENLTFVQALHDAAKELHRDASTEEMLLPLHVGAKRYFVETEKCRGIFCLFNSY
ncbi:MAG: TAXI family TRAP transporter solute-binding subunit [Hyphomicrobiales bacterium]